MTLVLKKKNTTASFVTWIEICSNSFVNSYRLHRDAMAFALSVRPTQEQVKKRSSLFCFPFFLFPFNVFCPTDQPSTRQWETKHFIPMASRNLFSTTKMESKDAKTCQIFVYFFTKIRIQEI